jgi:23S rRNA (cytosine1962-C5)-methyltransferase
MKEDQLSKLVSSGHAVISPKGAQRVRAGHLWIYRSDVKAPPRSFSGKAVRVVDTRGRFQGWAHFSADSEITLRLVSANDEQIDVNFWRSRLTQADEWRRQIVADTDAYRLVHAEGDLMPGLIVDRYGECLVIQTLTQGMDALKEMWINLLVERFSPQLIIERNDAKVRKLENLPLTEGVLYRKDGPSEQDGVGASEFSITENGLKFWVNLLGGQKTGAFLDQRENRAATLRYAHGQGLDCFSYHGSFALHLARVCERVTALEISTAAIERGARNAQLNGIANVEFVEANVFDKLREFFDGRELFDTIVLDPPAFAKNRGAVAAALRGYKEVNLRALRLLRNGGILVTCSCSYHVSEELFVQLLLEAARDARRSVQLIEKRTQARDHPALLTVPETSYLKCVVLRVTS